MTHQDHAIYVPDKNTPGCLLAIVGMGFCLTAVALSGVAAFFWRIFG